MNYHKKLFSYNFIIYSVLFVFFQNTKWAVTQYTKPYSNNIWSNFADQLTRNNQDPNGRTPQLTEEERNRLSALRGFIKVDDHEKRPHPDVGPTQSRVVLITSEQSGDLSKTNLNSQKLSFTSPLGQDLSELSDRKNTFSDRNRLFTYNKYSTSNSENVQKPIDDLYDFSYLYRNHQPPTHVNSYQQKQQPNYQQQPSYQQQPNYQQQQSYQQQQNSYQKQQNNDQPQQQQSLVNVGKNTVPQLTEIFSRKEDQSVSSPLNYNTQTASLTPQQSQFLSGRGIDWFETNIPRFSVNPPDSISRNRIVLDPLDPILQGVISIDSYLKKTAVRIDNEIPSTSQITSFNPGRVSGGNSQTARTRILTKESATPIEISETSSSIQNIVEKENFSSTTRTNFTTYPNFKADLFPTLENQAKEDIRPATGRRLGPQNGFGGGTNEYREDLGKNWAINDRRPPWEHQPGMGAKEPKPTDPLNRYSGKVIIENYPPNPDTHVQNKNGARFLGDDLSRTDAMGHNSYGPNFLEYTTPTPYLYGSAQTTTIIGVAITDVKENTDSGPASRFVGSGISPISQRVILSQRSDSMSTASAPTNGIIREYYGPEEVTGSRYRNLDEYFNALNGGNVGHGPNRFVKMDLLNE